MAKFALLRADGSLGGQVETRDGLTPAEDGSNPDGLREIAVQRFGTSLEQLDPVTGTWAEDPALVEAVLIAQLKVAAEARKMLVATPGGWKKAEYAAKRCEVIAWDELGITAAAILAAFAALPASIRSLRFEYAIADAAQFGDMPADAIARFRAGLARSMSTSAISALEAKTCAAVRSATTAAAKRAAYSAGRWN